VNSPRKSHLQLITARPPSSGAPVAAIASSERTAIHWQTAATLLRRLQPASISEARHAAFRAAPGSRPAAARSCGERRYFLFPEIAAPRRPDQLIRHTARLRATRRGWHCAGERFARQALPAVSHAQARHARKPRAAIASGENFSRSRRLNFPGQHHPFDTQFARGTPRLPVK